MVRLGLVGDYHGRTGYLRLAYEAFAREVCATASAPDATALPRALIDRLIIRGVFEDLEPRLMVTGHHHVRRTVRPDPDFYHREPRIEMMGRDGNSYGLASIYNSEAGSVLNVVLED